VRVESKEVGCVSGATKNIRREKRKEGHGPAQSYKEKTDLVRKNSTRRKGLKEDSG